MFLIFSYPLTQEEIVLKNKSVTLSDIAKELGVNTNAVSLALRGREGVSDALRERIVQKAREMNYTGLNQAQGCILALIPQRMVAIDKVNFYHLVCFQMELYAASLGYQLIISSVQRADEEALRVPPLLNTIPCAGIITVGNMSREYCKMIERLGLPYVRVYRIGDIYESYGFPFGTQYRDLPV